MSRTEREALVDNYINARYRTVVDVGESELRRYYEEVVNKYGKSIAKALLAIESCS